MFKHLQQMLPKNTSAQLIIPILLAYPDMATKRPHLLAKEDSGFPIEGRISGIFLW